MGPVAVQIGALVKLMRVLMLGPVCVLMGFIAPRLPDQAAVWPRPKLTLNRLIPWFIVAFLLSRFDVTLPVEIWSMLRSGLDPKTNAIGSVVFLISVAFLVVMELAVFRKTGKSS